ncbi:MAG: cobalamin biosynthesis protein [Clostridiales bacterium]|nr:cobalamin biosynthesis protein [Clostridiales bacterium]
MYIFCYARSERARKTGDMILSSAEGEWITDSENFVTQVPRRADGAVLLILPVEAAVKLLIERFYPADIKYPVLFMAPDGSYSGILRYAGYNTHEILVKICNITGARKLSTPEDRADFAPDLMKAVKDHSMTASDNKLLSDICDYIKEGGTVDLYTDLDLHLGEPVLDTLSFAPFQFRFNQKKELGQAYTSLCGEDDYSVFITCSTLPSSLSDLGKCLKLVPRSVVVGLELTARTDPDYARETVRKILVNHEIDPLSVATIAVSSITRESDAVRAVAEDLGCFVTSFDSRLLKAVKVPLNPTYAPSKMGADICTAAACIASDNGRILVRRAGGTGGILLTASMKKGSLILTE